jgi:4'-phosphopantetheinyl transferase
MAPPASHRLSSPWEPGPQRPALEPDALHVWRADLETVDETVLESLSPDELARAERFLSARAGLLWARSRGVLRELLAGYLEIEASEVPLARDHRDKPIVRSTSAGKSISFNVSHSGPLALYAFAEAEVGIDVQVPPRRAGNYLAIAARVFGPEQARRLEPLSALDLEREFLRAWAVFEAALKCRGAGLRVSERAGARLDRDRANNELWRLELKPGRRAAAAVACSRAPRELRLFSSSPRAFDPARALEDSQAHRLRERLAAEGGGERCGHAARRRAK